MVSRWARPLGAHRASLWVVTSAVLMMSVTASVGHRDAVPPDVPTSSTAHPGLTAPSPPNENIPEPEVVRPPPPPRGEPVRVIIPAIGVDVALVRLGLQPDRAMEVPDFGLAGWYIEGPKPGYPGPAVIAAHVDSRAGPDVFFKLGDLAAGDRVHVVYDSGDRVTFVVRSSEQTSKEALPTDAIWPTTNDRLLALITCGGEFDRGARSYRDNLVVYTTPLVRTDQLGDAEISDLV